MTNPDDNPDDDKPSLMPILTALAVIVVALIAIGLLRMFRGDETPDEGRIGVAAVGQNDALQRESARCEKFLQPLRQQVPPVVTIRS